MAAKRRSVTGKGGASKPRREGWQQDQLISDVCANLRYAADQDGVAWLALPEWMCFFAQVGCLLASAQSENRVTVALAVPTRAYAAVSVALGVVLARASSSSTGLPDTDHIERIRALPPGTSVRLRQGNRRLKGLLLGCKKAGDRLQVGVQVQNREAGGLERWLPVEQAESIQLSNTEVRSLPNCQKGRLVDPPSDFLLGVVGSTQAARLVDWTQLDCAIVGRANLLGFEIKETRLAYFTGESCAAKGSLQEILRVRRFMGSQPVYCSEIYPTDRSILRGNGGRSAANTVIFDGSHGYLRSRHRWRSVDRAVILDRTEPSFDSAVETVNQEYIQNRLESEWLASRLPPVPTGVEVMVFEEQKL